MLVGRRQNAYVDRPRFRPSDPADLLVLQYTQQLGLQAERQVADLVEEQRAAVRHLEQPGLGGMGVRKGAALVTEQLGLDEVLGECRAVHRDERGTATRAALVDRPCQEFLPGPRLADDQGARVAVWQEPGRPGQILLDGLALAHDGGERVRVTVRPPRSEEHTSELQSRLHLVFRLLLEKKNDADDRAVQVIENPAIQTLRG